MELTHDWPMPPLTNVPIGRRLEGQTEAAAHPPSVMTPAVNVTIIGSGDRCPESSDQTSSSKFTSVQLLVIAKAAQYGPPTTHK